MFCSQTKEFLSRAGVAYDERDIAGDALAMNELQKLGVMTTPVTVLGDRVIVGFDIPGLESLVAAIRQSANS